MWFSNKGNERISITVIVLKILSIVAVFCHKTLTKSISLACDIILFVIALSLYDYAVHT